MKTCFKCKLEKSKSEFYPNKTRKDGLQACCKDCTKQYAKTDSGKLSRKIHKQKNFSRYSQLEKQRKILSRYGLTVELYLSYFDLQDDKCLNPTCQIILEPYSHNACVDHNHLTEKVRGILCRKCNANVGWFENNKHWLESYVG